MLLSKGLLVVSISSFSVVLSMLMMMVVVCPYFVEGLFAFGDCSLALGFCSITSVYFFVSFASLNCSGRLFHVPTSQDMMLLVPFRMYGYARVLILLHISVKGSLFP